MKEQQTSTKQDKPTPYEEIITIEGGVDVPIKYKDGTTETIKVKQIQATKINEFAQRLGDEAFLVSMYCERPLSWVDTLTYESLDLLADKGLEINLPFFKAWFLRRAKWTDVTAVGSIADLRRKVETLASLLQSGNFVQQSPSTTASPQPK
jgi:hypothetical protein